jgi:hypothetical protein
MNTKKLTGKLAAGVRKVKAEAAAQPAPARPARAAASRPARPAVEPAAAQATTNAALHPARIWPD